jgi:hypothetical protein
LWLAPKALCFKTEENMVSVALIKTSVRNENGNTFYNIMLDENNDPGPILTAVEPSSGTHRNYGSDNIQDDI